jgi:hypothetical protein
MADNYKWGQLSWGDGDWGLQEPVTNGWGAYGWGESEWGNNTISVTVSVAGQSITSTLNDVSLSISGSVLLTGQLLIYLYPDFQKNALETITKHLGKDNDYYKYLSDRISCNSKGTQKYGTQNICSIRNN